MRSWMSGNLNSSRSETCSTNLPRKGLDQERHHPDKLSTKPLDPDSVSNLYGRYGSPFSPDSINNPFGAGNPYSPSSPTNPYGRGPAAFPMTESKEAAPP